MPLGTLLQCQILLGRCMVESAVMVVSAFASVLDPRPDLAEPARRVRTSYAWWW